MSLSRWAPSGQCTYRLTSWMPSLATQLRREVVTGVGDDGHAHDARHPTVGSGVRCLHSPPQCRGRSSPARPDSSAHTSCACWRSAATRWWPRCARARAWTDSRASTSGPCGPTSSTAARSAAPCRACERLFHIAGDERPERVAGPDLPGQRRGDDDRARGGAAGGGGARRLHLVGGRHRSRRPRQDGRRDRPSGRRAGTRSPTSTPSTRPRPPRCGWWPAGCRW